MEQIDPLDLQVLAVVGILLGVLYIWIRRSQVSQKERREMKARCRDLILDNRHSLAAAGVDIEALVNLVRMNIACEQLKEVIKLLVRPRKQYNVDDMNDPRFLEVNLNVDGKPVRDEDDSAVSRENKAPGEGDPGASKGDGAQENAAGQAPVSDAPEHSTAMAERMSKEEESSWLKLAHKRFRDAIAKRNISDRRARLRLLVKMVELGKKAVDEDPEKPPARKDYERNLWDRFYENEYLELNSD